MGTKWLNQLKIRQFAKGFFTVMLAVYRGKILDSVVTKRKSEEWLSTPEGPGGRVVTFLQISCQYSPFARPIKGLGV